MESHDYPIEHFELMRELATQLKSVSILILEHNYNYESFGSWWFTFMLRGERYRIVYDGKNYFLNLEQNIGRGFKAEWREVAGKELSERDANNVSSAVSSLLSRL